MKKKKKEKKIEEKKKDHSNDRILWPQPNASLCESNISCVERTFRTAPLKTLRGTFLNLIIDFLLGKTQKIEMVGHGYPGQMRLVTFRAECSCSCLCE